jgi:FkbM family methyltransferase
MLLVVEFVLLLGAPIRYRRATEQQHKLDSTPADAYPLPQGYRVFPVVAGPLTLKVSTYAPSQDLISASISKAQRLFCDNETMTAARRTHASAGRALMCLDIGANLGSCGLQWLAEGLCKQVVFYEANARTFSLLRDTLLREWPLLPGRAILRHAAASNARRTVEMSVPAGNYGHSTVGRIATDPAADPWRAVERKLSVSALRPDEDPASAGAELVKIDVEGHECSVLEGLKGRWPSLLAVAFEADEGLLKPSGCSVAKLKAKFPTRRWQMGGGAGWSSMLVATRKRARLEQRKTTTWEKGAERRAGGTPGGRKSLVIKGSRTRVE